jgi:hypothetical protein
MAARSRATAEGLPWPPPPVQATPAVGAAVEGAVDCVIDWGPYGGELPFGGDVQAAMRAQVPARPPFPTDTLALPVPMSLACARCSAVTLRDDINFNLNLRLFHKSTDLWNRLVA